MAYVPIHKDLSNVKSKVMLNLTKRQLICFSLGAFVGLPTFFAGREFFSSSVAVALMMILMSPFFLLAMFEKHNQPLEVLLMNYVNVKFVNPKIRPYMTKNYGQFEKSR